MINGSQLYTPEEKILTKFLKFKPIGNSGCLSVKIFGYLNEGTARMGKKVNTMKEYYITPIVSFKKKQSFIFLLYLLSTFTQILYLQVKY